METSEQFEFWNSKNLDDFRNNLRIIGYCIDILINIYKTLDNPVIIGCLKTILISSNFFRQKFEKAFFCHKLNRFMIEQHYLALNLQR